MHADHHTHNRIQIQKNHTKHKRLIHIQQSISRSKPTIVDYLRVRRERLHQHNHLSQLAPTRNGRPHHTNADRAALQLVGFSVSHINTCADSSDGGDRPTANATAIDVAICSCRHVADATTTTMPPTFSTWPRTDRATPTVSSRRRGGAVVGDGCCSKMRTTTTTVCVPTCGCGAWTNANGTENAIGSVRDGDVCCCCCCGGSRRRRRVVVVADDRCWFCFCRCHCRGEFLPSSLSPEHRRH